MQNTRKTSEIFPAESHLQPCQLPKRLTYANLTSTSDRQKQRPWVGKRRGESLAI